MNFGGSSCSENPCLNQRCTVEPLLLGPLNVQWLLNHYNGIDIHFTKTAGPKHFKELAGPKLLLDPCFVQHEMHFNQRPPVSLM